MVPDAVFQWVEHRPFCVREMEIGSSVSGRVKPMTYKSDIICMYMCICVYIYVCVWKYVHMCMRVYIYVCDYVYIMCIIIYMWVYIYIYINLIT